MKILIRIADLFLYTSLFTACCAVGLCMATEQLISSAGSSLFSHLHLLIFGSTLLVYNTPRIVARPYGKTRPVQDNSNWYVAFFFIGLVLSCLGMYAQPQPVLIASGVLAVFAFGYFLPVLPFKSRKRLRDFGGLKILVLAGVWTTATTLLPIFYLHRNIRDYPFEIILRFVFIFTLCVIFDIRDMRQDQANNISTLPQKVGIRNSYYLINATLLLFVIISIIQYTRYPLTGRLAGAVISAIVTRVVVSYLRTHPSDKAYLFLADGVMLVYAALALIS